MGTANLNVDYSPTGTDWTPALRDGLDDIKVKGGKIVVSDDIEQNTQFRTADVTSIPTFTEFSIEGDGGNLVTLDGITGNAIVTNSNFQKFGLKGLNFIGDADGSHAS